MVLQVLGNLYGLLSSGRNFSKAMNIIVLKLEYKNTPYDPKFFCEWINRLPILVVFRSDGSCWCGPPTMLSELDALVKALEESKYKVKDCTNEPFLSINVSCDKDGNYYLDQNRAIEGVVKATKLGGAKIQKLRYPLDGKSMSKEDNPKDDTEVRLVAKTKFKAIIGMLSYIAGQNVLSKFCNNPGRRHIIFLNHLVKYCEYSKNDRL